MSRDSSPASGAAGKIVIRRHAGVDPDWEAFVESCPGGHHVQTSRWADVKAVVGWGAARVLVRRDGASVAGCQLLLRKVARVGTLAYAPRGPVLAGDAEGAVLDAVLDAVESLARAERALYLKVQPPADDRDTAARLAERGYAESSLETAPTATVLIDVRQEPEELLAAMRTNTRRNVRKARKAGLTVRAGSGDDLGTLCSLIEATARRQSFPPYPPAYYEQMWRSFAPSHAHLLVAERAGAPLVRPRGDRAGGGPRAARRRGSARDPREGREPLQGRLRRPGHDLPLRLRLERDSPAGTVRHKPRTPSPAAGAARHALPRPQTLDRMEPPRVRWRPVAC